MTTLTIGSFKLPSIVTSVLIMLLGLAGGELKNKDSNSTGLDDFFGSVCVSLASSFSAIISGSANALTQSVITLYIISRDYLLSAGIPLPDAAAGLSTAQKALVNHEMGVEARVALAENAPS